MSENEPLPPRPEPKAATPPSGDVIEISIGNDSWQVIYKQTQRGDDKSRVGFDIVAP